MRERIGVALAVICEVWQSAIGIALTAAIVVVDVYLIWHGATQVQP